MSDELRSSERTSWIAEERLEPGPVRAWWVASMAAISTAMFVALTILGTTPEEHTAAEQAFRDSGSWFAGYANEVAVGRLWSAVSASVLVFGVAWSARRLLHSDWVALFAGALVALDPLLLVYGRLALPVAPTAAAAIGALAFFLSPRAGLHWVGAGLLAIGAAVDPRVLWWGLPIAAMTLLRGHIYAAPKHVVVASSQTLLIPLLAALPALLRAGSSICAVPRTQALILGDVVHLGHGLHALPNLTTWFAGMVALLFLAGLAAWTALSDFRMQRMPGRIQIRLSNRLRREHGRVLWIALLAVTAPSPWLFLPVFAFALAAMVKELGRDAPPFALVVAVALIGLAAAGLARFAFLLQGGVTGEEVQALLEFLPWADVVQCASANA